MRTDVDVVCPGLFQLEDAAGSQEAQDALLEDRRARALRRLLLVMDVAKLPRRARRNFRSWQV